MFQFETWTRIYPGVIYNLKMLATAVFILISQIWAAPPQPPAVSCGNGNYVPFKAHTDAYKTESEEQKLDIWIPQGAPKPYKTIVLIHGGCFKAGGRDSGDSMIQINRLVKAGYAVASVDYRVTKMDAKTGAFSDTYPTSLNDVQDAWCWLQKNGSNRGLDTEKMVAMGYSAGGTLGLYMGTQHTAGSDHVPDCKPKVAGVVDLFGRSIFTRATEPHGPEKMDCGEVYAGQHRVEGNPQQIFKDMDVQSHLDAKSIPPIFISHGTLNGEGQGDTDVNPENSEDLCKRLGDHCDPFWIPGAGHMYWGKGEMESAQAGACTFLEKKVFNDVQMATISNTTTVAPAGKGDAQH